MNIETRHGTEGVNQSIAIFCYVKLATKVEKWCSEGDNFLQRLVKRITHNAQSFLHLNNHFIHQFSPSLIVTILPSTSLPTP
ncbi:hypothetical protein E2C01_028544 [Portunus trituberculatus]|uniref:Uncharacterized protein n=1 Tax=Portunus trituberculatus TaxID=210409 RepID=A0A5B7EPA7_PORTR|nr:hypothetical protein [Portunus trituberculatus]